MSEAITDPPRFGTPADQIRCEQVRQLFRKGIIGLVEGLFTAMLLFAALGQHGETSLWIRSLWLTLLVIIIIAHPTLCLLYRRQDPPPIANHGDMALRFLEHDSLRLTRL